MAPIISLDSVRSSLSGASARAASSPPPASTLRRYPRRCAATHEPAASPPPAPTLRHYPSYGEDPVRGLSGMSFAGYDASPARTSSRVSDAPSPALVAIDAPSPVLAASAPHMRLAMDIIAI